MKFVPIVFGSILLAACQTSTPQPAVLDATAVVTQPGPEVLPEMSAFSGVWAGTWGEKLDGKLAILTVSADGAVTGIYAVGESPGFFEAQSYPVTGRIVSGVLTIKLNSGIYASYKLQPDGSLAGEYRRFGRLTSGVFRRTT